MATGASLVHEGWMDKKGEKGLIKSYKRRWFKLHDDGKLMYFTNGTCTSKKGTADLGELTKVDRDNAKLELRARTPDRVWLFKVQNTDEMEAWYQALDRFSLTSQNQRLLQSAQVSTPGAAGIPAAEVEKLKKQLLEKESAMEAFKRQLAEQMKAATQGPTEASLLAEREAQWELEKSRIMEQHSHEKAQLEASLEQDDSNDEVKQKLKKMKEEMAAQKDLLIEAATSVQTLEEAMDKQEQQHRGELERKRAEFMSKIDMNNQEAEILVKKARLDSYAEGHDAGLEAAQEEFSVTQARDYDPTDVMQSLQAAGTNIKVLEGNLIKFGKAGKTDGKAKFVRFVWTGAEGLLFWSQNKNDPQPNLLKVQAVSKDHQLVQRKLAESEKDGFFVADCKDNQGGDKRIVFMAKDAKECAYWFDAMKDAVDPMRDYAIEV